MKTKKSKNDVRLAHILDVPVDERAYISKIYKKHVKNVKENPFQTPPPTNLLGTNDKVPMIKRSGWLNIYIAGILVGIIPALLIMAELSTMPSFYYVQVWIAIAGSILNLYPALRVDKW